MNGAICDLNGNIPGFVEIVIETEDISVVDVHDPRTSISETASACLGILIHHEHSYAETSHLSIGVIFPAADPLRIYTCGIAASRRQNV